MRVHRLETETWLARAPGEVFPFFADAFNLERITPSFLRFRVVTPPPIEMREGALIDYRLRVRGVPIRWRTEITAWDPPRMFRDEQVRGPYLLWRHTHTFEEKDGGTLCRDEVEYAAPLGWLSVPLLVRRDVESIFRFRARELRSIFGGERRPALPSATAPAPTL